MPPNEPLIAKKRPVYLDIVRLRLPLPGFVSILHRISGAGLFLVGIPLALYALQMSLGTRQAFDEMAALFARPWMKLLLFGLAWAYFHHFCAGIRFLLLD